MANGFESPVQLPNAFPSPGEALQSYINNQQHQKALQYQLQKDKEAQDWKKANAILDIADLSKHLTANDAANALGYKLIGDVIQKWSNAASGMPPDKLIAGVQKDTSGIIANMDSFSREMKQLDADLEETQKLYPNINVAELGKFKRADIAFRRLKNDSEFNNPLEVKPSKFNLNDPEFLSDYIQDNKEIFTEINNPKGTDQRDIWKGNMQSNSKYTAKIPFWKKPNYEENEMDGLFLKGNKIPKLLLKSSMLSPESFAGSGGKPTEIIDEDVLRRFEQNGRMNLELISATKDMFPDYKNFSSKDKEYAKRHVLANMIKSLDNSDFRGSDINPPPKWVVMGNSGKSSGSSTDTPWVDIIREIEDKTSAQNRIENNKGIPFNELSGTTQGVLLDYTNKATGGYKVVDEKGHSKTEQYTQGDIFVSQNKNGELKIHDASDGHQLLTIDRKGVAIKANTPLGIKGKTKAAQEADKSQKQQSQNTSTESAEERLKRLRAKYH